MLLYAGGVKLLAWSNFHGVVNETNEPTRHYSLFE